MINSKIKHTTPSSAAFIDQLEKLLLKHKLKYRNSNIFEGMLLKSAGINTIPYACEIELFSTDNEHTICIELQGLHEAETNRFLEFLKTIVPVEIGSHFSLHLNDGLVLRPALPIGVKSFTISLQSFLTFIVPKFVEEMTKITPDDLEQYKKPARALSDHYGYPALGMYFNHLVLDEKQSERHIVKVTESRFFTSNQPLAAEEAKPRKMPLKDFSFEQLRDEPPQTLYTEDIDFPKVAWHPIEKTFCLWDNLPLMPECDFPALPNMDDPIVFAQHFSTCLETTLLKNTFPEKNEVIKQRIFELQKLKGEMVAAIAEPLKKLPRRGTMFDSDAGSNSATAAATASFSRFG